MNTEQGQNAASPPDAILAATVSGLVQGVGFRAWIRHVANTLELRGYVRNTLDGTVYLVAHGDDASLQRLIELLRKGPAGADVSDVSVHWLPLELDGFPERFEIRQ